MAVQKISVIVPAYNAEKTIEKTIRSILAQDWPDLEVIVVDDGSADRTAEICAGICAEISGRASPDASGYAGEAPGERPDPSGSTGRQAAGGPDPAEETPKEHEERHSAARRVRLLKQANAGPAAARNLALQNAEGELICFVDADDTIQEDCLRTFAESIRGAQMAVCGYNIIHPDGSMKQVLPAAGRLTGTETMKRVLIDETVDGFLWNKVFLADIIRENGIRFDEKIYIGEDMLFVEQYLRCCPTVRLTDRPVYNYFVAGQSISHAVTERNLTLLRAFARAFGLSGESEYRDLAVNRYVRQYLVFYVLYPDKARLEKRFETFLERTGYSDGQILEVLPRAYRARFRFYRASRPLYAACLSGLRGAKDVLFGPDRVLKKK